MQFLGNMWALFHLPYWPPTLKLHLVSVVVLVIKLFAQTRNIHGPYGSSAFYEINGVNLFHYLWGEYFFKTILKELNYCIKIIFKINKHWIL